MRVLITDSTGKKRVKDYIVKDDITCKKCKSFVPFSGSGVNMCLLYVTGRCPEDS